jgi:hypothetical protein
MQCVCVRCTRLIGFDVWRGGEGRQSVELQLRSIDKTTRIKRKNTTHTPHPIPRTPYTIPRTPGHCGLRPLKLRTLDLLSQNTSEGRSDTHNEHHRIENRVFTTVLSRPVLSCPVLSCPVLSCPVLSCPVLSCLVLFCSVLFCLVLSCPVLAATVRTGSSPSSQSSSPSETA